MLINDAADLAKYNDVTPFGDDDEYLVVRGDISRGAATERIDNWYRDEIDSFSPPLAEGSIVQCKCFYQVDGQGEDVWRIAFDDSLPDNAKRVIDVWYFDSQFYGE
jgi:hypothetical protein